MNTYDTMELGRSNETIACDLRQRFRQLYGEPARVYRALSCL